MWNNKLIIKDIFKKKFTNLYIFNLYRQSFAEAGSLQLLKPLCVLIYIYLRINRIFFLRQKAYFQVEQ